MKRDIVTSLNRKETQPQPAALGERTFETLDVYKAARAFRVAMYAVTRRLPTFEKFELASQIRRASVSLTNNIAEGHGRYHYLDQIRFMLQSRGSLEELIDDLNVCADEKYMPSPEVDALKQEGWRVLALLNGYIRYLRQKKSGQSLQLHDVATAFRVEAEIDEVTM